MCVSLEDFLEKILGFPGFYKDSSRSLAEVGGPGEVLGRSSEVLGGPGDNYFI